MKNFAAILLWMSLALLWICGGAAAYAPAAEGPGSPRSAGIYPAQQQAISMMQRTVSIYEVPSQVRVPASEQILTSVRSVPASLPAFGQPAPAGEAKSRTTGQAFSPACSKTARSADRYVYGLRKIII